MAAVKFGSNTAEKLRTATALRQEGHTIRHIGEKLSLSATRVYGLLAKARRLAERGPHSLSVRATNLMCHASQAFADAYHTKQPESSLKELASDYLKNTTERELRKVKFPCGPKTIAEISAWCGSQLSRN